MGVLSRLVVVLVVCVCGSIAAASATAAPAIGFRSGWTDNYKACWNADPSVAELRTWMPSKRLVFRNARGTTFLLSPDASYDSVTHHFLTKVTMRDGAGRAYTLRMRIIANGDLLATKPRFRVSTNTDQFGPWVTFKSRAQTGGRSLGMRIYVENFRGVTVAERRITYRPEPSLQSISRPNCATATGAQLEWNGPTGRWWVAKFRTRFDWQ